MYVVQCHDRDHLQVMSRLLQLLTKLHAVWLLLCDSTGNVNVEGDPADQRHPVGQPAPATGSTSPCTRTGGALIRPSKRAAEGMNTTQQPLAFGLPHWLGKFEHIGMAIAQRSLQLVLHHNGPVAQRCAG